MSKMFLNLLLFIPIAYFGFSHGNFIQKSGSNTFTEKNDYLLKLDQKSVIVIQNYGNTIRKYSDRYGLDWRLVLAVMKVESRFYPTASSYSGAEGLMQIMPVTQSQIATELGMENQDFTQPQNNIRGGIYYLGKIYKSLGELHMTRENRIMISLAAYNAGPGRIVDAQTMAIYVNDNPNEWKSIKNSLSLLSRKYSRLHRYVWEDGRPQNGYFRDWQQTSKYVETVMAYYREYCRVLPNQV